MGRLRWPHLHPDGARHVLIFTPREATWLVPRSPGASLFFRRNPPPRAAKPTAEQARWLDNRKRGFPATLGFSVWLTPGARRRSSKIEPGEQVKEPGGRSSGGAIPGWNLIATLRARAAKSECHNRPLGRSRPKHRSRGFSAGPLVGDSISSQRITDERRRPGKNTMVPADHPAARSGAQGLAFAGRAGGRRSRRRDPGILYDSGRAGDGGRHPPSARLPVPSRALGDHAPCPPGAHRAYPHRRRPRTAGAARGRRLPEQHAIDRDELRQLAHAIAAMPLKTREAFVLRRVRDMPQREIAARMRISENTVETHISRGILFLMDWFGRGGNRRSQTSMTLEAEIASIDGRTRNQSRH